MFIDYSGEVAEVVLEGGEVVEFVEEGEEVLVLHLGEFALGLLCLKEFLVDEGIYGGISDDGACGERA